MKKTVAKIDAALKRIDDVNYRFCKRNEESNRIKHFEIRLIGVLHWQYKKTLRTTKNNLSC